MSDAKKDPLPLAAQLTKGIDSVDLHEFAGGIAQEMATLPQIRVGRNGILRLRSLQSLSLSGSLLDFA